MQHHTLPSCVEQLHLELETRTLASNHPTFLAIDANPYEVRMVTATPDGLILDHLHAGAHQIMKAVNFVRRQRRSFPGIILTGARHDRWPPGFLPALVMEFGPIHWASELMLKQASSEVRRCTNMLKFFRSTFIALCAGAASSRQVEPVLEHWKRSVIWELMLDLDVLPLYNRASALDDIPF